MRRFVLLSILSLLIAAPALAQVGQSVPPTMPTAHPPTAVAPVAWQTQTAAPPAQAPRAEAVRAPSIGSATNQPMPSSTNIRLELVITDTFTGAPVKKSVSLLVVTGNSGMIRTSNTMTGTLAVLNVDAVAAAYQSGLVSTRLTFEYSPPPPIEGPLAGRRSPSLNESITVVLQDGKPMVISQSADPATDRKVTVELTATILK